MSRCATPAARPRSPSGFLSCTSLLTSWSWTGSPTTGSADRPMMGELLVIGAGPAGSATAWWLARAGKRVVLADRARFPRDKPCSEYMGPGAVTRLERLGVMPELRKRGARP